MSFYFRFNVKLLLKRILQFNKSQWVTNRPLLSCRNCQVDLHWSNITTWTCMIRSIILVLFLFKNTNISIRSCSYSTWQRYTMNNMIPCYNEICNIQAISSWQYDLFKQYNGRKQSTRYSSLRTSTSLITCHKKLFKLNQYLNYTKFSARVQE